MDIWEILGIEETKDKKALKAAYRDKLSVTNPEDDPEGFMQLRRAYEEADKLADATEETHEEALTGLEATLTDIYNDFDRRIDENVWRELFASDDFVALDKSAASVDKLIRFISKHLHIPSKIYKLIVDEFDIIYSKKELTEKYSEELLEFIIGNAQFDDTIDYYLFDGNEKEFDEFIDKYMKLDLASKRGDVEIAGALINKLEQLDVEHPYLQVMKVKHHLQELSISKMNSGEKLTEDELLTLSELQGDIKTLIDDYGDNVTMYNCLGDVYMFAEDYDNAQSCYEHSIKLSPGNYVVTGKLADLAYYKHDYVKSRDLYMNLLKINHYDNTARNNMIRANKGIIETNRKLIEDGNATERAKYEIAWSCYQSYMFKDGIEMLDSFTPAEADCFEYYNVKGRTYMCINEYEKALDCFFNWKKAIEEAAEDDYDKKKRYPYTYFLIADCYMKLGHYDEAEKYLKLPLEQEHDERILSYEANCELKFDEKNYGACLDACDKLLAKESKNYNAYLFKLKALYELKYYQEAFAYCEKAILTYPYAIIPYVYEVKVLLKYKQYNDALTILQRYSEIHPESDSLKFYSILIENERGGWFDALDKFEGFLDSFNPDMTDIEDVAEVYSYIGDAAGQHDNFELALQAYTGLAKREPKNILVHGDLAFTYKKMCRYEEALREFDLQCQLNPHHIYYINSGIINKHLCNFKSALRDFHKALELDPANAFCYSRIGMINQLHRQFAEALSAYDRALELTDKEADPDLYAEVTKWKGRCYQNLNEFEKAKDLYHELTVYCKDNFKTVVSRGWYTKLTQELAYLSGDCSYRAGLIKEAKKGLEAYVASIFNYVIRDGKLSYNEKGVIKLLLEIYSEEGDIDKAFELYQNITNMFDDNNGRDMSSIHAAMAKAFAVCGRYEDAEKLYMHAQKTSKEIYDNYAPELLELMNKTSGIFKSFGANKDQHDVLCRLAEELEKHFDNPYIGVKLIRYYRVTKQYVKALKTADKAINMRRCDTCLYMACEEAYYEQGLTYAQMKKYNMAIECIEKALAIHGHCGIYERKLKELKGLI